MGKKLWAFAVDFWRDGSALLGFIAAPLSIFFTLAKAFDVEVLGHLREISYAWALAPITLWIFVAYVRIHARTSQDGRKEILRSFYASAGPIITRELPKQFQRMISRVIRRKQTFGPIPALTGSRRI